MMKNNPRAGKPMLAAATALLLGVFLTGSLGTPAGTWLDVGAPVAPRGGQGDAPVLVGDWLKTHDGDGALALRVAAGYAQHLDSLLLESLDASGQVVDARDAGDVDLSGGSAAVSLAGLKAGAGLRVAAVVDGVAVPVMLDRISPPPAPLASGLQAQSNNPPVTPPPLPLLGEVPLFLYNLGDVPTPESCTTTYQ